MKFNNFPRPGNSDERVFINGIPLEEVHDFKHLGSFITSTSRDINVGKGLAWKALQSLVAFWKYNRSRKIMTKIFRTAIEPVLLYGAETWTLKEADIRALDGLYTRMLRRVLGISWKSHTTNFVLYEKIQSVTDKDTKILSCRTSLPSTGPTCSTTPFLATILWPSLSTTNA